ncbi:MULTISPECIES: YadA-like family protein [unclassified Bartonella]|uniref:YadA-like family protein n=1 Tax=unclassified Bartonella TaxID=2645622 RepID=UPI0035CEB3AC
MKKIYTTPHTLAVSNLKNSCSSYRLPFIKTLSLVSVAVFLSNASPVSACDKWGNVAEYFGGGANILKSVAPTYVIDGNVYRDVGSAFVGVNSAFRGVKNEFSNFKLNIGKTIKFEVGTAIDNAFAGWGNVWGIYQREINNKIDKILSDMIVKQDAAGLITIGANKRGYIVDVANNSHEARFITGVRDGLVSATSNHAITGSQLYKLGAGVAKSFGGGASYKDGNWSAPTFTVNVFDKNGKETKKKYNNVADAFAGVNDSFVNINKEIKNVVGDKLVAQDTAGLITIGRKVRGTKVSIANVDNAARTLSGVKAGSITAVSTDAINGSQLYSMSNVVAGYFGGDAGYKDGNWSAPTFTVKVFDKDGNGADKNYHNVADAFTGVSSSFTNIDKKIENVVTNVVGDKLVKQNTAGLITIGGEVNGANVSIANVDNAARTLSGVKAGSITAVSTDAINGSQFHSMSNVIARYFSGDAGYDEDGNWSAPTFTVKVFDENGNGAETHYGNVAEALSGVSSSFTNLNKKIESVTGDSFIKQNSAGLITIGGSKSGDRIDIGNNINTPRVLSGVRGGAFTKTSTEAVNGSQLYFMTQAFANYFGGGAGYDEEGKWSGPTFTVKVFDKDGNESEKKYNNVADAFAGVNSAFTALNNQIIDIRDGAAIGEKPKLGDGHSDIISEGFPFMRKLTRSIDEYDMDEEENDIDEEDLAVSYDVDTKSGKNINRITLKGVDDSEPVLITNVKDGEIKKDSKDAVNGGQLHDYTEKQMKIALESAKKYTNDQVSNGVNEAKSYTDMKFDALSYDITNVRKEARQAAAIGLAVSNLRYFDDPGSVSVSFGGGFWRGQSAFAIGAGYTSEDGKIRSNLSATSAGGQWGVGGGITLKLK